MVNWTPQVDNVLFKHILLHLPARPKYDELEKAMRTEGIDVTAKAISHRFTKLRNATFDGGTPLGAPNVTTRVTYSTGDKRKIEEERKAAKTPKGVVGDGNYFNSTPVTGVEAEAEDEEQTPPVKRAKKTGISRKKRIFIKHDDEEEGKAI